MSIYVGNKDIKNLFAGGSIKDYLAIRGPAPDGFHVPLITEWQGVKTIMDSLSLTTGDSWRINLHIPFAGRRHYNDADVYNQSVYSYCLSSSPYGSSSSSTASRLSLNSSTVNVSSGNSRALASSIRCFKDSYVKPTSSWTVINGTLGGVGIFWNQSEGLISITNGTTGYTIMDKNLGATTVYNDGDTLTQANMGNFYQWGNNYGFPSTGTYSKTSSAQVNAQNYGPGNYYESDTFIIGKSDWSSVHNDNLRGGVTGIISKKAEAKAVYLGNTKVRPVDKRTFTISWTEKSDMSSGWTYSDDAAGLTAGDTAFDEFFGYYGVRLSKAGVETNKVEQSTPGTLDITQLGTLTSGDDVMIAFPKIGYKMSKSGSTVTLSLTRDPNKTSEGYRYYAFTKGSVIKNVVYLGAYEMNSNYGSLSGATPKTNQTRDLFRSAVALHYNDSGRHSLMTYRVRDFIKMLYMMKYGNPNSQTVIGKGLTSGSAAENTGVTNSITSATGATNTSNKGRIKLFGLEDIWGNVNEFMDCCFFNSYMHLTVDNTNSIFQDSAYSTDLGKAESGLLAGIDGSTEGTFRNISTSGGSTTAYYCDRSFASYYRVLFAGGDYSDGNDAGIFYVGGFAADYSGAYCGSRLQFL